MRQYAVMCAVAFIAGMRYVRPILRQSIFVADSSAPPVGYNRYASPMLTAHEYIYERAIFQSRSISFLSTPMNTPITPGDSGKA